MNHDMTVIALLSEEIAELRRSKERVEHDFDESPSS